MEGAAAVNDGLGRQCVERAAQAIAWEDWVPLEGGAQFAQGLVPSQPHGTDQLACPVSRLH